MIEQHLMSTDIPYLVGSNPLTSSSLKEVPLHFHYELEILYCISEKFTVTQNGRTHTVNTGELVIVGSMIPHSYSALEENT